MTYLLYYAIYPSGVENYWWEIMRFTREKAASVAELGLLAGLIAVVLLAAIGGVGDNTAKLFSQSSNYLDSAMGETPVITPLPDMVLVEDAAPVTVPFQVTDADTPIEQVTIKVSSSNQALISDAQLSLTGSLGQMTLVFAPLADQEGEALLTITAADLVKTGTSSFKVTVTGENDDPVIAPILNQAARGGEEHQFEVILSDSDTDLADIQLNAIASNSVHLQNVTVSGTGATRTVGFTGLAAEQNSLILLTATDGEGGSVSYNVPVATVKGVYASCSEAYGLGWRDDGVYDLDVTGGDESDKFATQCDMTREGGGWTLVASIADDGQNNWNYAQRANFTNNVTFGDANSPEQDFKNPAWSGVSGSRLMLAHGSNTGKYALYDSFVSGSAVSSKYSTSNSVSPEYYASKVSGSWVEDCHQSGKDLAFRTNMHDDDTDISHVNNAGWAVGFVFRSQNNGSCYYDDTYGWFSSSKTSTIENWGNSAGFMNQNFSGSALHVWVK